MANTVYHLGYNTPLALARLLSIMQHSSVDVIDVRQKPSSRKYLWRGSTLASSYKERYVWMGDTLGNTNYEGGPISIPLLQEGVELLSKRLDQGRDVLIICGCHHQQCHRFPIVKRLSEIHPGVRIVDASTLVPLPGLTQPCISFRQPYGTWVADPAAFVHASLDPKRLENREYLPSYAGMSPYEGPVLIHASKTPEWDALRAWKGRYPASLRDPSVYPLGAIVGIARLTGVVRSSHDPWFVGRYGWVMEYAQPLLEPVPYPGELYLFEVPTSAVSAVLPSGYVGEFLRV